MKMNENGTINVMHNERVEEKALDWFDGIFDEDGISLETVEEMEYDSEMLILYRKTGCKNIVYGNIHGTWGLPKNF